MISPSASSKTEVGNSSKITKTIGAELATGGRSWTLALRAERIFRTWGLARKAAGTTTSARARTVTKNRSQEALR